MKDNFKLNKLRQGEYNNHKDIRWLLRFLKEINKYHIFKIGLDEYLKNHKPALLGRPILFQDILYCAFLLYYETDLRNVDFTFNKTLQSMGQEHVISSNGHPKDLLTTEQRRFLIDFYQKLT